MHLHTLYAVPLSAVVLCEGCPIQYRLATREEADFIHERDAFAEDGPMQFVNGQIVVPRNYSIRQEV